MTGVGEFTNRELAGGVIDTGQAKIFAMAKNGGEIVRFLVVQQGQVVDRTGRENACDLAFDEFSGNRFGSLLRDGDAFSGF